MNIEASPISAPSNARARGGRRRRLALAISVAAGLLALGAPAAAHASTSAASSAAVTRTVSAASALQVGDLNGVIPWALTGAYAGCYFDVGDRYEGNPGGAAVGMAKISCPTPHYYRIKVYLDYTVNGTPYTASENVNGTLYYGYSASVPTGCVENVSEPHWITYAQFSIDNLPYSNVWATYGGIGPYAAGPYCR
jgi:hypothetical protein